MSSIAVAMCDLVHDVLFRASLIFQKPVRVLLAINKGEKLIMHKSHKSFIYANIYNLKRNKQVEFKIKIKKKNKYEF